MSAPPVRFLATSFCYVHFQRFGSPNGELRNSAPAGRFITAFHSFADFAWGFYGGWDSRDPVGRSGFPRSLIFGGFRRKRSSIVSLCSLCSLWLISFADNVRTPVRFLATHLGDNRALFQWQARTPAVDADVDPPKRKRPPIRSLRSLRSLRLKILWAARLLVKSLYFALDKIA